MSNIQDQGQPFDLLERTLETFGADTSRWPVAVQARLSAFIASNGAAQKRVAEVRALDAVLEFAPRLNDERSRHLIDAIISRAARQPRVVTSGGVTAPTASRSHWMRRNTVAAAALAASLVIGVVAGQNATVGRLTEAVVGASATVTQQVAQSDDTESLFDEDLL